MLRSSSAACSLQCYNKQASRGSKLGFPSSSAQEGAATRFGQQVHHQQQIRYQRDQTEQGIDEIQWTVEWRSLKPKGRVKGRMITGCAIRHAGGGGRAVVQKGLMRTTKGMPLEKARGACTHVPKGQGFVAKAFLLFVVETGRPENRTAALRACAVGRGRGRLGRMAGKHIRSHAADNEKACCPCHLPEGTACRRRAT